MLEPVPSAPAHLQACFLDEETKARENRKLQAASLAGEVT